jgi:hypothetical protein
MGKSISNFFSNKKKKHAPKDVKILILLMNSWLRG